MDRKFRSMAGVGALLALAVPMGAVRAEEPLAPRITRPGGTLEDRAILVEGYGYWPRDEAPPLRTAQPLAEPFTWFGAGSALTKAHLANPEGPLHATILLDITAQGAIAGCRYTRSSAGFADEAQLCAEIAGQRFLPKLADDGTRVAGTFTLSLLGRGHVVRPDAPPRPLYPKQREVATVAMLESRADSLRRFPPNRGEVYALYRAPQWKVAPQPGWGDTRQEGPMTGLILYRSPQGLRCRVLAETEDPALDAAACTYGMEILAPDWSAVEGNRDWMVPIAILHRAQGILAIGPDPDPVRETVLAEGVEDALVAALTAKGVLGKDRKASPLVLDLASNTDGSLRHCRVVKTTGKDATDIAACMAARETVRLVPFEDVFGTPNPLASLFWRANPAMP